MKTLEPWLLKIANFRDSRGSLTVLDNLLEIGFLPKRIFIVSEIPKGLTRGSHSHKEAWQILIALNGSVEIEIENIHAKSKITLEPLEMGLCVPPNNWIEFRTNDTKSSLLVLASTTFDETDYVYERPTRHETY